MLRVYILRKNPMRRNLMLKWATTLLAACIAVGAAQAADKKPNVVMLMHDDTGWFDFGCYGGGASLGHPTPNVDRMAAEGARFTSWYGQASCTAGRCSFMTGRIPIRSALSVVVVPGDRNSLKKETRPSPSSTRRTVIPLTFLASGISVTCPSFIDRTWLQ